MRRRLDDAWTRLVADDETHRRLRHPSRGLAVSRNSIEDVDYGRHVAWTLSVGAASVVLSLLALRSLFGRGALVGPGLLPLPESWQDGWEAAWSTWVPGGLGVRGPGVPLVRLLGHLPTTGGTLVEVIVFTAVPLSALTAWWAAGALTRAVGARLALAVTWALAPSLLSALTIGSWPLLDRKSTRLNSSHVATSYAVFCLKTKNGQYRPRHYGPPFTHRRAPVLRIQSY